MNAPSSSDNPHAPQHLPGGLAGGEARLGDHALQNLHARLMRDKEEPREGFSLIPIFLIFLGCVLTYLNGIYIVTTSGAFRSDIYDSAWVPGGGEVKVVDPMVAGAKVFKANCQQCHGADGMGQPGTYPPLAGSPWPMGNPARAISILQAGLSGPLNVLGQPYNNSMPYVGSTLSPKDFANVLTYVRNSFGNHGDPVEEGEITQVRGEIGNRNPWTPSELLDHYPLEAAKPAAAPAEGAAAPAPAAQ